MNPELRNIQDETVKAIVSAFERIDKLPKGSTDEDYARSTLKSRKV
jgi:hypothetical protein